MRTISQFNLKLPWHIYTRMHAWILSYLPKQSYQAIVSVNVIFLFANDTSFLLILLLKRFFFLQFEMFLKLIALNFPSCCLTKVNIFQNFISF